MEKNKSSAGEQPSATWVDLLRKVAGNLKYQIKALYIAYKDPRSPWYAKACAAFVVMYLASPIDLIPDFIPVLGYLDDLIVVPAGIALAIRLIPSDVMAEAREKLQQEKIET
jgi:uncharacterized membrane protein YkvA (DUF1232 family)